jgi:hypothetical protein
MPKAIRIKEMGGPEVLRKEHVFPTCARAAQDGSCEAVFVL